MDNNLVNAISGAEFAIGALEFLIGLALLFGVLPDHTSDKALISALLILHGLTFAVFGSIHLIHLSNKSK